MRTRLWLGAIALLAVAACAQDTPKAVAPTPTPTVSATPSPTPSAAASPTPSPSRSPEDPLSPKPAVESPAPLGQPPCAARTLTVQDADAVYTDDAVHEVFVIRTSGPACQLDGWPTVRLLDAKGRALAVRVSRGGYGLKERAPEPVTLTTGTSASFLVATARTGSCVPATSLEVVLPGTTTALRAPTGFQVCDGAVGLTPVLRLTDDEG